jgi:hypothetical protein
LKVRPERGLFNFEHSISDEIVDLFAARLGLFTRSGRCAPALLTGGPVAASREMIEAYRLAASANCSRLSIAAEGRGPS